MSDLHTRLAQPYAPLTGVALLMRRAYEGEDISPLVHVLVKRAEEHPDDANALLDCAHVLILTGHRDVGLAMQQQALQVQTLYSLPAANEKLRLLALMGPGDLMANTPLEFLLEGSDVSLQMLYLQNESDWPDSVPEHDVMVVAVAESDANQPLLQRIGAYIANWPRPVVNFPQRISILSRDGVCAELQGIEGVELPMTRRVERSALQRLADGELPVNAILPHDDFPLIVRPLDSHAGDHLEKIDSRAQLAEYLRAVDVAQYYVARFVDYCSADGQYRKYRIALIDGWPYLCHLAISSHWMVHYLNAGMDDSVEKRNEEAHAMTHFDQEFAARHAVALRAICERLALPYLGLDCSETRNGKLLVFESDNAMIVHTLDPVDKYPYKRPAMQKVIRAFREMLDTAASMRSV